MLWAVVGSMEQDTESEGGDEQDVWEGSAPRRVTRHRVRRRRCPGGSAPRRVTRFHRKK